jgi:hypothetical protein
MKRKLLYEAATPPVTAKQILKKDVGEISLNALYTGIVLRIHESKLRVFTIKN